MKPMKKVFKNQLRCIERINDEKNQEWFGITAGHTESAGGCIIQLYKDDSCDMKCLFTIVGSNSLHTAYSSIALLQQATKKLKKNDETGKLLTHDKNTWFKNPMVDARMGKFY